MHIIHKIVPVLFSLALVSDTFADDTLTIDDLIKLPIEQLLNVQIEQTSSKKDVKLTKSSASITVVTQEEIKRSWAMNIPDLLRNIAGVDVIGIYSGSHMVSIRGSNPFSSLKVALLVDGQPLEPLLYGTQSPSQLPFGIDAIERIEVVRSPGGLYGGNALYGLINFILKKPSDKPQSLLSAWYGDYDDTRGSGTTTGKFGKFGYRLHASALTTDEEYPKEVNSTKISDSTDRLSNKNQILNTQFTYDISKADSLSSSFGIVNNHYWSRLPDRLCETLVDGHQLYGQLKYQHTLTDGDMFRVSVNHDESNFQLLDNGAVFPNDWIPDWNKSLSSVVTEFSGNAFKRHSYVVGAEWKHERTNDYGVNHFMKENVSADIFSIYGQDQVQFTDQLLLYLGARGNHHYVSGYSFAPSASLVFQPHEDHTFRIAASRNVRNPNVYETKMDYTQIFGVKGKIGRYLGNEEVGNEINNAYELAYIYATKYYKTEVVGFFYDGRNLFNHSQVGNETRDGVVIPVYMFDNNGHSHNAGVELVAEWIAQRNIKIGSTVTYTAINTSSRVAISPNDRFGEEYAPRYKANLYGTYSPIESLEFFASLNYVDSVRWERPVWSPTTGVETILHPSRGGYTTFNMNATYFLTKNVDLSLRGTNLFDQDHMEWPVVASTFTPRRLMGLIRWRF